jgi:hypothetical protein
MSKTYKEEYITQLERTIAHTTLARDFTKFSLEERLKDESAEERAKVKMKIDQMTQQLEEYEAMLVWLQK